MRFRFPISSNDRSEMHCALPLISAYKLITIESELHFCQIFFTNTAITSMQRSFFTELSTLNTNEIYEASNMQDADKNEFW